MDHSACPRCMGTGSNSVHLKTGSDFKERRKSAGVSMREIAKSAKWSIGYISDLEQGKRLWTSARIARYETALTKNIKKKKS